MTDQRDFSITLTGGPPPKEVPWWLAAAIGIPVVGVVVAALARRR